MDSPSSVESSSSKSTLAAALSLSVLSLNSWCSPSKVCLLVFFWRPRVVPEVCERSSCFRKMKVKVAKNMQFREDYPKIKTQPYREFPSKCPKGLKRFFHFFQVSWMDVSRICWEVQSLCFTRLFVNFSTQRRLGGAKFLGRATRQITGFSPNNSMLWFRKKPGSRNRFRRYCQLLDLWKYTCVLCEKCTFVLWKYTLYFETILLICTCESVLSYFESILVYFVKVYLCTLRKVHFCTLQVYFVLWKYTLYFERILWICTCESVLSYFESILVYFVKVYLCTLWKVHFCTFQVYFVLWKYTFNLYLWKCTFVLWKYTLYFERILLICTCESVLSYFESILCTLKEYF